MSVLEDVILGRLFFIDPSFGYFAEDSNCHHPFGGRTWFYSLHFCFMFNVIFPGDHEPPAVFSFGANVSLSIYYNFSFKYSVFMQLIHLILNVKQINGPLMQSLGTLI